MVQCRRCERKIENGRFCSEKCRVEYYREYPERLEEDQKADQEFDALWNKIKIIGAIILFTLLGWASCQK